jgi:hypothetical protein
MEGHLNMELSIRDQQVLILDVVGLEVILLLKVDGSHMSNLSEYPTPFAFSTNLGVLSTSMA